MSTHTPGPWEEASEVFEKIIAERDRLREVNAEMLRALKALTAYYVDSSSARGRAALDNGRAAIAKAEGRSA